MGDLKKWVDQKWVDIGAPKKDGKYQPCGRKSAKGSKGCFFLNMLENNPKSFRLILFLVIRLISSRCYSRKPFFII